MARRDSMELAEFKFFFDGKVFGTRGSTEPEKIREEPFASLEVGAVAPGDEELTTANRVNKKGLQILWSRFRQANFKWEFGARSYSTHDCPAEVGVYLLLTPEFVRELCQLLPNPVLHVEGSLELGMKPTLHDIWWQLRVDDEELDISYELVKPVEDEDSGPLAPWKLGVISVNCFFEAEHEMKLMLRGKILLEWGTPLHLLNFGNFRLQIEDWAVVKKLLENVANTDVTIVGGDGSKVHFQRSLLAHYGNEILRRLSQVEDETWEMRMPEIGVEAGLLLGDLLFGKAVPFDDFDECEVALQLLQAGHQYKLTKVEAGMAIVIESKEEEWYSTDVALKLFFFLQGLTKEEVKVHARLMEQACTVLAKMPMATVEKSEVYEKLALNEREDLDGMFEEMKKKGIVRKPSPNDGKSSDLLF